MYKNATKCNETIGKWCKTKHGASKIIDTFETYQTSAFFFGHNPTNICVRTRLTNSKISWIDIQFASSKLTAVIRGSLPGCRVDKDTPINPAQQRGQRIRREGKR
jgi:hypothetical protein